jgi:hypothetical protein
VTEKKNQHKKLYIGGRSSDEYRSQETAISDERAPQ